jgi:hypothetical protein
MNGSTTVASASAVPPYPCISGSRGVLALQGTGQSVVSIAGAESQASKRVIEMDKPMRGWHSAFAIAGAFAPTAGRTATDAQAALLRTNDPRSVIRSRHRSRQR